MRKLVSKGVLVVAGVLFSTGAVGHAVAQTDLSDDPRLVRLQDFFRTMRCPVQDFAAEFLIAADRHSLDWRLLPSIAVVETGGGKTAENNNIFGWKSGKANFPSVQAAIYLVASQLANSRLYKDKDLNGVLATYNRRPAYPPLVKSVMGRIGPRVLTNRQPAATATLFQ